MDIFGVRIEHLEPHLDDRGKFAEIFRQAWIEDEHFVQWNYVRSKARVLRGVHAHIQHSDYLVCVEGRLLLGLHDIRPKSVSYGISTCIELRGSHLQGVFIPKGVAHGFYFSVPSAHVYGVTHYWDLQDELCCRWNDPELNIRWPIQVPIISERDATSGSFNEMKRKWLMRTTEIAVGSDG